ncbi:SagB/ThcOx family dehydrogenase [Microbulbifer sp. VAAF005]|uniref:SagB/ThcOx family dehydrogenase n=1 Tax=Microbulbifer sp. VAAF005 TaxID=3034230 RepID=UPI0024ADAFC6|nr:SagB/ThcOx family dehydrogenase [Microbulbifer sp. VAAF005]WHI47113.1 SagB/ThcOx family dehydrogenase [Microbulbifer sp. VAAF005]
MKKGSALLDSFFLYFSENEVILWDVVHHDQWALDKETLINILDKFYSDVQTGETKAADFLQSNGAFISGDLARKQWGWDVLSWFYHYGTKLSLPPSTEDKEGDSEDPRVSWVGQYVDYCKQVPEKAKGKYNYPEVDIPLNSFPITNQLESVFGTRFSSRKFVPGATLKRELLEKILFHCVKFRTSPFVEKFYKAHSDKINYFGYFRSSPAGGALQATDIYLIVHSVQGIDPGIYLYNPIDHGLTKVGDAVSHDKIRRLLVGQPYAEGAAVNICFVCKFNRFWSKYRHSRIYRMAYLEAGHLSENIFLYAHSLKQDVFIAGAFYDEEFESLLKLDKDSAMVFFMAIGEGEHACFPVEYLPSDSTKLD